MYFITYVFLLSFMMGFSNGYDVPGWKRAYNVPGWKRDSGYDIPGWKRAYNIPGWKREYKVPGWKRNGDDVEDDAVQTRGQFSYA